MLSMDPVEIQEIKWTENDTIESDNYTLFYGKHNLIY